MTSKKISNHQFVAIDGDDVGLKLRDKIIANDIVNVQLLSSDITDFFLTLKTLLVGEGYKIVFCGGDSILAIGEEESSIKLFNEFPKGPCTVSVGISETAEQAYLALQLAKARGKNQVVNITKTTVSTIYDWSDHSFNKRKAQTYLAFP